VQPSTLRGRCHKFGDDIFTDTKLLPYKYGALYPFDAEKLVPHLFEEVTPDFHKRTQPGDFIVAGKRFAYGKSHPQGFIAMAALKLNLLCESMPYKSYRGAIGRGIVTHRRCEGIAAIVNDGDEIEMDFATGELRNLSSGASAQYAPVQPMLLEMMLEGGTSAMLARWRDAHPESMHSPIEDVAA
jgi:3-isopropylmalate/(R)-2-methylmalate dehydratase small subunit